MLKAAAAAAMSRRAEDGVILDLRELDGFTDFFAIFSGNSDIQVEGISQAVLEELETNWEQKPWHQEGTRRADWILLDYVDFVVHVFLSERRAYYNLERLWAEAERIELPGINNAYTSGNIRSRGSGSRWRVSLRRPRRKHIRGVILIWKDRPVSKTCPQITELCFESLRKRTGGLFFGLVGQSVNQHLQAGP